MESGYADPALAGNKAMMVAGLGCRNGATAEAVAEALAAALERCGLDRAQIDALATDTTKGNESGIVTLATALAIPLIFVATSEMQKVANGAITSSERVIALKGVPSVAETAALAAAGRAARLLGPRVSTATATCAIAVGEGPSGERP
jgi:cobalt-precorrin 5A hydrolase